ncbi:chaplin [Spongiactinospora sp. TRM90649]|uniref:chaplin n=1 Tax=Spongiactinospora sp. TRM90649 TaxID=3031114 RepID=UPI0023F9FA22|nr:chaplin [Spongiactinospora sp. TRM90649]MDF5758925.1 chaplin [Spongiactinospora sp. TRM90649]
MLKKVLMQVGVAAGIAGVVFMASPAHATIDHGDKTSGDASILGGNQIKVPITAPINVCGNQVNVIAVPVLNPTSGVCTAGAKVRS